MSLPNFERSQRMAEADLSAVPWVDRMVDEMRSADPKAARFPYTELRGPPRASSKTNEPYHATVVLRKDKTCRGTGMSVHVFLDGTIKPSRKRYNVFTARAASVDEMGKNAHLLNSTGAGDGEAQTNETIAETSQAQGEQKSSGQ
ncbi:hypothetical protein E4U15_004919 [Claviceps sp. LM218 group G6]|nr:hypothetical protein E4U15_004919 [Claviceps sp. LM218 group G6]